jgi:hypothetical protein
VLFRTISLHESVPHQLPFNRGNGSEYTRVRRR